MVSVESWYILIKPINTYIWIYHIYTVKQGGSWFPAEIYVTFVASVLEVGNSTSGEQGVIGSVAYSH